MSGMRYGSAPSRRARLLELVRSQGFCATSELVQTLGVSDMTVRRDVQRLSEEGKVRIVHGGVSVLPPEALSGSGGYLEREGREFLAKQRAGQAAAELVAPDDHIALDAGTTVLEVARALPAGQPNTVVSHSATVLGELMHREEITLVGSGGVLHHETMSFAGATTLTTLAELRVGRLFLAASGVNEAGVFCANDFDAVTKRALIDIADEVVLVIDSSKFHTRALVRICPLDVVDTVVVDDAITAPDLAMLERHGVRPHRVPVGEQAR
ncbi:MULTISPECIES: DeoR/GlpR family DNA-binding transcription regulator [Pseudonocardia]|uniref:Glycerol-3-phosphate regulon repressor n=2 Tax=Pseudonocardia TaxID=1847 RepID=A0A1Y2MI41_PSEAH|nr:MULTISPECIES: DeoR/GlpR family DNA-binding transcription regulator [Pseudonocardia]OSY34822.1 Glycerol-3-phosphate regulon repressor [Pseudonocardia autotrophica]TDN73021.1 DeoR family transcriptional regulator [Pseudonocardia autotrophica]BBG03740.1 DNA-binding transcriptional regulator [Pseudonocardia autotrophica]GEC29279.1 DNA-binding transcriptional regulator [Pseudonocardia saturnea]